MEQSHQIQALIVRYLNGDCSENEVADLLGYTSSSAVNSTEFFQVKDLWDMARHRESRAAEQLILFYKKQLELSHRRHLLSLYRIAAIAAVLVIAFVASFLYPSKLVESNEQLSVFSVPLGSRSKVILTDGTEVHLNSGSSLSYPGKFDGELRRVTLSGEGFFKVKSDKKHPFIVKTADFDVEATGTQFNVCTYDNDPFSSATLAEGLVKVRMKNTNQLFTVKPGEKLKLNRTKQSFNQTVTDIESELAWKDGEFIFKSIPFPELVQRLERWYDVKLTWSGKNLETFSYTGRFKNQETIWQVLDALKLTTPINYQKTTFREFKITYQSKK